MITQIDEKIRESKHVIKHLKKKTSIQRLTRTIYRVSLSAIALGLFYQGVISHKKQNELNKMNEITYTEEFKQEYSNQLNKLNLEFANGQITEKEYQKKLNQINNISFVENYIDSTKVNPYFESCQNYKKYNKKIFINTRLAILPASLLGFSLGNMLFLETQNEKTALKNTNETIKEIKEDIKELKKRKKEGEYYIFE